MVLLVVDIQVYSTQYTVLDLCRFQIEGEHFRHAVIQGSCATKSVCLARCLDMCSPIRYMFNLRDQLNLLIKDMCCSAKLMAWQNGASIMKLFVLELV